MHIARGIDSEEDVLRLSRGDCVLLVPLHVQPSGKAKVREAVAALMRSRSQRVLASSRGEGAASVSKS